MELIDLSNLAEEGGIHKKCLPELNCSEMII